MKHLFLVGNWKSNKTEVEALEWLGQWRMEKDITIILCVPFTLLSVCKKFIDEHKLPISLGAQDLSEFPVGSYTGAINAAQIKEFADYVMIGHSERRNYFHETDNELAKKTEQAVTAGLKIIYCVQSHTDPVPAGVSILLYEPAGAIGTGNAESPDEAEKECALITASNNLPVIYGGSVTEQNVALFSAKQHIMGVVVGKASLDPTQFIKILSNFRDTP